MGCYRDALSRRRQEQNSEDLSAFLGSAGMGY